MLVTAPLLRPYRPGVVQEIPQEVMAHRGHDGLRMELYPLNDVLSVPYAHHLTVLGGGGRFQWRQRILPSERQGMIPSRLKGVGKAPVYGFAVVMDKGRFAVSGNGSTHDGTPTHVAYALVPQADPQDGKTGTEAADYLAGDTCLLRIPRPGGDNNALGR